MENNPFNQKIEDVESIEKELASQVEKALEGNPTEFLLSRVNNEEIFKQIVSTTLLVLSEEYPRDLPEGKKEEIEKLVRENIERVSYDTPIRTLTVDEMAEIGSRRRTDPRKDEYPIDAPMSFTVPIGMYDKSQQVFKSDLREEWARELIPLKSVAYDKVAINQDVSKVLVMAVGEAHEKGHIIRMYKGKVSDEYFRAAFDLSVVNITDDYAKREELDDEKKKQENIQYVFSAVEIVERMNQVKCYFGFIGDEKFEEKHLTYAKKNYIKDTGIDNGMEMFFSAITENTQKHFLRLINSSGI